MKHDFNMGGSIEKALSGDYELKLITVFQEAWKLTVTHFTSFTPAIFILAAVQIGVFYLALQLQLGDPSIILDAFQNIETFDGNIMEVIFIASFSYEVITVPLYAGANLMGMSHAVGLKTRLNDLSKGLYFTIPLITATLFSLLLQGVAGSLVPFVSFYLSIAFSNSILLICEKKISPLKSLWLSLRAINKKLFTILGIYSLLCLMVLAALMLYGIGLIILIPFFFHVKGIIYRNMFGIRLHVVTQSDLEGQPQNSHPETDVFDA